MAPAQTVTVPPPALLQLGRIERGRMTLGSYTLLAAYILFFGSAGVALLFGRLPDSPVRFFQTRWYRGFLRVLGFLFIVSLILNVFGYLHSKL